MSRFVLYSLLTTSLCTARLQLDRRTEEISTTSSALFDLLCLDDGTICGELTTCANCCAQESYVSKATMENKCGAEPSTTCLDDGTVCGVLSRCANCCAKETYISKVATKETKCGADPSITCLVDGTTCYNATHIVCDYCCNGNYADNGYTCGGQCLPSGTPCEGKSVSSPSCNMCCDDGAYRMDGDDFSICGCMKDGTPCDKWGSCHRCCNGAFDDNGNTCGGQCLVSGTECGNGSDPDCSLCCNNRYWYNNKKDKYECGCIEDGKSCIPGENCWDCCNGNYNDGGYTCSGRCLKDGMDCIYGEDCHTCCTGSSYWYSVEKWKCGIEPCYEDGESCIPGVTCKNCCGGGAYDGDGTICGGKCLPSGTECSYYGTCSKCCTYKGKQTDRLVYPESDIPYHWDSVNRSMVCEYEMRRKDGADCIPGVDCFRKCYNTTFSYDSDGKCGRSCYKSGTKCNYYGSCKGCCEGSMYDVVLGHHICSNEGSNMPVIEPTFLPSSLSEDPTP
jgi:hypothetical protein